MYRLLLDRHEDRERHTEYLTGLLAATIVNWSMGAPETPRRPADFALPLLRDVKERERRPRVRVVCRRHHTRGRGWHRPDQRAGL